MSYSRLIDLLDSYFNAFSQSYLFCFASSLHGCVCVSFYTSRTKYRFVFIALFRPVILKDNKIIDNDNDGDNDHNNDDENIVEI